MFVLVALWMRFDRRNHRSQHTPIDLRLRAQVDVDRSPMFLMAGRGVKDRKPYFIVVDTETALTIPEDWEEKRQHLPVIQIAFALLNKRGELLSEHSYLLKQDCEVSGASTEIHGITTDDLLKGYQPERVMATMMRELKKSRCMVAHNIDFHRHVLMEELQRIGMNPAALTGMPAVCTQLSGRSLMPSGKVPSLTELFGLLYYNHPNLEIKFSNKSIRDIRLSTACLKKLIQLHQPLLPKDFPIQ